MAVNDVPSQVPVTSVGAPADVALLVEGALVVGPVPVDERGAAALRRVGLGDRPRQSSGEPVSITVARLRVVTGPDGTGVAGRTADADGDGVTRSAGSVATSSDPSSLQADPARTRAARATSSDRGVRMGL